MCGYDVRVDIDSDPSLQGEPVWTPDGDGIRLEPGKSALLSIIERFTMPTGVVGFVKDKSTWSRQGLFMAQAVIEPGWEGFLSIRVVNNGDGAITIVHGEAIAQVVFHSLDATPENGGYDGKYQNQESGPQGPKFEA